MTTMNKYERPIVRTLRADQIVESMGPVSCGSGQFQPMPDNNLGGIGRGTGFSDASQR